ncbi:MAG: HAD-IIIC family phosphatase [Actinobacteria bacterium]|nr:HAD-IIIC family phosphatase [Actinomycetota bacterium]
MDDGNVLERIRRVRAAGAAPDPDLRDALGRVTGNAELAAAGRLLEGVPPGLITPPDRPLRPMRVGVTGTFTAESVVPMLRVLLLRGGIAPHFQLAGFDQLMVQLADPGSVLARFDPDLTLCLLHDGAVLPQSWDPAAPQALRQVLADRLGALRGALAGFTARIPGTVLLHTVPLSPAEHRAVIAHRSKAALGRVWREFNLGLLELPELLPSVQVLDLEALLVDHPGPVRDDRLYRFASMAWTPAVERHYAQEATTVARAVAGLGRKVLVLDLDNTLWGGVLGDDGPDGLEIGGGYPGNCYTELQRVALTLRQQGVLLALCSKNDPAAVEEVFARHPDLVLRPDDVVARAVNWGRKDHNLRELSRTLDLRLDSFVFADDSRFECALIRRELPDVEVLHLAGDPAGHVATLLARGHFDVLAVGDTDRERTQLYRARARRADVAASFESAADYLRDLDLRVTIRPADSATLLRVVQLERRTNQFNLAGGTRPEARTRAMAASANHLVLAFTVADRFGDEGVVGGVWVALAADGWEMENFVMSCRVFGRGIEHAVLSAVVNQAGRAGAPRLSARWRPSGRNDPVREFLDSAGFTRTEDPDGGVRYDLPLPAPASLLPDWITLEDPTAPEDEGVPAHA